MLRRSLGRQDVRFKKLSNLFTFFFGPISSHGYRYFLKTQFSTPYSTTIFARFRQKVFPQKGG
jgi:hypothetical protein